MSPRLIVGSLLAVAACNHFSSAELDTCTPDTPCDVVDAICETDATRCECMQNEFGSPRLYCEPASCPEPAIIGESCGTPGLQCDFDGYDHSACMDTWVRCKTARFAAHCPQTRPQPTDVCCVIAHDAPTACTLTDGSVWDCIGNRWVQQ